MENYTEKRSFTRVPYEAPLDFIVLVTQEQDLQKIEANGKIIDASDAGIGIMTDYPLQPGHILEWDDKHQKGKLHIAMVKWSQEQTNLCRAGLLFV